MDHPFGHVGHHHHHHHNRRDDDDESNIYPPPPPSFTSSPYPPPPHQTYPPPSFGGAYDAPPPPSFGGPYDAPPPPSFGGAYDPPPPAGVYHSSHGPPPHLESQNYPPPPHSSYTHHEYGDEEERPHHGFRPHMPGFIQEHFNPHSNSSSGGAYDHTGPTYGHEGGGGPHMDELANKPTHKIYCKAGGDRYTIGIREGKLVLTHPDHEDPTQHWYKDERYSTKVKDKDGYPSFILVNKGTGQAAKHPVSCHPVQLVDYQPDVLDESVLWTESKDLGSGFRTIRTVNNVKLVLDAWNADQNHGGIHDGTLIALFDVWKGDNQNQQWKLVRY